MPKLIIESTLQVDNLGSNSLKLQEIHIRYITVYFMLLKM